MDELTMPASYAMLAGNPEEEFLPDTDGKSTEFKKDVIISSII
jgi:hypothetical protein